MVRYPTMSHSPRVIPKRDVTSKPSGVVAKACHSRVIMQGTERSSNALGDVTWIISLQ